MFPFIDMITKCSKRLLRAKTEKTAYFLFYPVMKTSNIFFYVVIDYGVGRGGPNIL